MATALDALLHASGLLAPDALAARNGELISGGARLAFTEKGRRLGCFVQVRHPTAKTAFEDHTHDFLEISFILKGGARHQSGAFQYPVKPGDLFFLNHHWPHRFIIPPGKSLTILNFHFLPEFLEATVTFEKMDSGLQFILVEPFLRSQGDTCAPLHFQGPDFLRMAALGLLMHERFNRSYPEKDPLLPLLFKVFLTQVLEAHGHRLKARPGAQERQEALFREVLAFIETRKGDPLSIRDISKTLGIGRTRLAELFKKRQGTTLVDHIRRRRIAHAQELLAMTSLSVVEIALETGFGDLSNFNRAFKAIAHMPPRAWRASCKKSESHG